MAPASEMENILTLDENNDGELFLELPDELLDSLGWDDGTAIQWTVVGDSIRISKVPEELLGRPEMEGNVSYVERGNTEVDGGDADVVGEPSY
jgi:hypothetical protein